MKRLDETKWPRPSTRPETFLVETETRPETQRSETETSRPRPHPWNAGSVLVDIIAVQIFHDKA